MANIICMKWGAKYGPEYVNKLHSMVSRHLSLPHRFVCFTDDRTGIVPGVECLPLPEMNLPPGKERGWRKLSTFVNPLFDLTGPTLFLDVDIVVTGSLDGFFEHAGKFLIIHDWARPWRVTGNSSVYRFEASAHPEILDNFLENIDRVKREVRNEQEYLTREVHRMGYLGYWPSDWCVSFKKSCIPPFPINLFKEPALPAGARVVVFHGSPNPDEAVEGRREGFMRFMRPAPWINDHWC